MTSSGGDRTAKWLLTVVAREGESVGVYRSAYVQFIYTGQDEASETAPSHRLQPNDDNGARFFAFTKKEAAGYVKT